MAKRAAPLTTNMLQDILEVAENELSIWQDSDAAQAEARVAQAKRVVDWARKRLDLPPLWWA